MYKSREDSLEIARRFLAGEITKKEARELIGGKRNCVYYWVTEYKRSIGDQSVPSKYYQPKGTNSNTIKDEVVNEDEISRLSSLSKEELIDEVIKAKVNEARAKKGYEVKGGGANKEFVTLNNKNTK